MPTFLEFCKRNTYSAKMMEKRLLLPLVVIVFLEMVAGKCPAIVLRSQWEARRPRLTPSLTIYPSTHVIIHHTSGSSCYTQDHCMQRLRQIQNEHMDEKKFDDIGFNFLIGGDGTVFEGRGWTRKGSHSAPFDSRSIGIAYIGNFALWLPTAAARSAGRNLISCGASQYRISKNYKLGGHRQANDTNTFCPGLFLYNLIRGWPNFSNNL